MLNQITLACYKQGHHNQKINSETWCVSELFCSKLKRLNTNGIKKINIDICSNNDKAENYVKYSTVLTIYMHFDFKKYFKLSNIGKKTMQLSLIRDCLMKISHIEGWETDFVLDAYVECLKDGLEYSFWVKNKFIKSPDKKYSVGIRCEWDIDRIKAYVVVFEKKIELNRMLFIDLESKFGEFIYYINWKWIDNTNLLIENKYKYGDNEFWKVKIR